MEQQVQTHFSSTSVSFPSPEAPERSRTAPQRSADFVFIYPAANTAGLTTKWQRLDSSTASAWWMERSPRRLEWTIALQSRLLETSLINELVPRSRLQSGGSHYPASRRASWGTLSLAGERGDGREREGEGRAGKEADLALNLRVSLRPVPCHTQWI